jgi:hypothetical protein
MFPIVPYHCQNLTELSHQYPHHRGLVQHAYLELQNLEIQDTPLLVTISVTVLSTINNNIQCSSDGGGEKRVLGFGGET